jgi:hypothetical protein
MAQLEGGHSELAPFSGPIFFSSEVFMLNPVASCINIQRGETRRDRCT